MFSRLSTVHPDLEIWLLRQPPERMRQAAASAARLAVERTGLIDRILDPVLTALRNAQLGHTAERSSGVQQLIDELDAIAWDLRPKADIGAVPHEAYIAAFSRARAAASVGFALGPDALNAALETVYEAHAATGDLDAIRAAAGIMLPGRIHPKDEDVLVAAVGLGHLATRPRPEGWCKRRPPLWTRPVTLAWIPGTRSMWAWHDYAPTATTLSTAILKYGP